MADETVNMDRPWEALRQAVASEDAGRVEALLEELGSAETARAISRLSDEDQSQLLAVLAPEEAAEVIDDVSEAQAVDLIEDLPPDLAAAIIDRMPSDHRADLLADLSDADAEAILSEMSPETAAEARELMAYPAESAGGTMASEFLAYRQDRRVSDVVADLRTHADRYADYSIQYLYVVDGAGRLVGVLRMRDLLFAPKGALLGDVMIREPLSVRTDATVDELIRFFSEHRLLGVPVVDDGGKLVGLERREAVEDAERRQANRRLRGLSGIIGGEEFRQMPLGVRSVRRLAWLGPNIPLNLLGAAVIALYQDTLEAAIALAIFLPIISDMSGNAGFQAVGVSIRELSLGLVRQNEIARVLLKEASLGVLNGIVLGLTLGVIALVWKGLGDTTLGPMLGAVIGGALALNTVVAVSLGGLLPLVLNRMKLDPAMVSGPILTTITDMCGFFLVLSFASAVMA